MNQYPPGHHSKKIERTLFSVILLLEFVKILSIQIFHRVPLHDAFQFFYIQYYNLNEAIISGEIPQWIPYLTHGRTAYVFYSGASNFLTNVLMYTGGLLQNINFLAIFNASIFFDKLILLVGTWLLCRRFFSSLYTAFFVSLCVLATSIWMTQIFWTIHLIYTLPLIIYLLHHFLDCGEWKYCFLAFNLFILQIIDKIAYIVPLISLTIFLYFLFYTLCNYKEVLEQIKNLKWRRSFFVYCLTSILLCAAIYTILSFAHHEPLAKFHTGRSYSGLVPLQNFLTYGGNIDFGKWFELILGVSPALDYTLYIGLWAVPLILIGWCFNLSRKNLHFTLLIIILLLFSIGSFVSSFFYYTWPLMKYYRHLALAAPIIKLFLCFIAGFGFEVLLIQDQFQLRTKRFKYTCRFTAVTVLILSLVLYEHSIYREWAAQLLNKLLWDPLIRGTSDPIMPRIDTLFHQNMLPARLATSSLLAFIASVLFFLLSFINVKRYRRLVLFIFFSFHILDLYGYSFSEIGLRTTTTKKDTLSVTSFQKMPYRQKRSIAFMDDNERGIFLSQRLVETGTQYGYINVFLFKDQLHTPARTDNWMPPFDKLIRAYSNQPIDDVSVNPLGLTDTSSTH